MSEQTIFNGEVDQTPPVVTSPPPPVVPTELQELVGQGKKYATLDDAIKSVPHAQTHIAKLEQEAAQLREELQKRKAAEDLLADIKAGITQQGETTPKVDLSQETVSNIVKNVLKQEQESNIQAQNAKSVMTAFETAFGDKQKAEQEYIKIAEKNNLPVQMLNQLAMTSPEAVLNLAGLKKTTQPVGKVSSDVNTINFNTTEPEMPSAKLKPGATTKDMVAALQAARQKVLSRQSN